MFTSNLPTHRRGADFVMIAGEDTTEFRARNRKAGIRISIIDDLPAESCHVGNWAVDHFRAKLEGEGFNVMVRS